MTKWIQYNYPGVNVFLIEQMHHSFISAYSLSLECSSKWLLKQLSLIDLEMPQTKFQIYL